MSNLNRFYSGGFFLIREMPIQDGWPHWVGEGILSDIVLSLSECVCTKEHIIWEHLLDADVLASDFGIDESERKELIEWTGVDNMERWSLLPTLKIARYFIEQYVPDTEDLLLVEIGLPHELENNFHEERGESGLRNRILRHLPMTENGTIIGYEIVSSTGGLGHSLLCNRVEPDLRDKFHIRLNQYSLIDSFDEAVKVYEWIEPHNRPEPEPYDFWVLVVHPLED